MSGWERSRSAAEVVRELVLSHPCLLDCMLKGIVNYSALARLLAPRVSEVRGRRVNEEAVKMALIRFSESLRCSWQAVEDRVRGLIAKSVLNLQTDISVVTVRRGVPGRLFEELVRALSRSRFFQVTQGFQSVTFFVAREDVDRLLRVVGEENVVELMEDQSALIVKSPRDIVTTPGVVAYITSLLAWNGINISQIISCHDETMLIVARDDALRTYRVLEELILSMRRGMRSQGL